MTEPGTRGLEVACGATMWEATMRRTQSAMVLAVLISLPAIWAGGAAPAVVAGQPLTVILVDGPRLRPADVRHA